MSEEEIEGFLGYLISDEGEVISHRRGARKILRTSVNNEGVHMVSLMNNGARITRSVALLVLRAFNPEGETEFFDTAVHLDGDRGNLRLDNLIWRPRWFAIRYHHEINQEWDSVSVRNLNTNMEYSHLPAAMQHYGVLGSDILKSTRNRLPVFPHDHIYANLSHEY